MTEKPTGEDPLDRVDSEFFSTTFVESASSRDAESDGDLWPSCWADDDFLYAANGDGRGFDTDRPWSDVVVNRIGGTPERGLSGERLAAGDDVAPVRSDPDAYNRKPTGMVAVDGNGDGTDELYLAVQDLRKAPDEAIFDDAPCASIAKSVDYGDSWETTDEPMFAEHRFTTIFFLDYGQSYENVEVLGTDHKYVYAYGLDNNWRCSFSGTVPDPTNLYLARVPRGAIQHRSHWEFFAGTDDDGSPDWSESIDRRVPVLSDDRRVYPDLRGEGERDMTVLSQGSVVYNAPLDRYIYTSWTEYTFEFYEAPEPWGPWRLFARKDFGSYPWFGHGGGSDCPGPKHGGYATTVPSKFVSDDGERMWVQSNWFVGVECGEPNYNFSLRRLRVTPYADAEPTNDPDPEINLATSGADVTPIERCARHGNVGYLNSEGGRRSEDSRDGRDKPVDYWGYVWSEPYAIDRVVYTTGEMRGDGGWFAEADGGLRVQVRQEFEWIDVNGLSISPAYPYDESAGPYETYDLRFEETWGDGIRIVGCPGGSARFTSIAELEVYYDGAPDPDCG